MCEANEKIGRTVLPHPAHNSNLAPAHYHLYGPVKDAHYVDAFLRMTWKLNKVFVMYSEVESGNFTKLVYGVLLNIDKNVLKMTETLWNNCLITAKDV
jgi:hypothetical protein